MFLHFSALVLLVPNCLGTAVTKSRRRDEVGGTGRQTCNSLFDLEQAIQPLQAQDPRAPRAPSFTVSNFTGRGSKVRGSLPEIPAPFSTPWECHSMGLLAKNNCPKTWESEGSSQSQEGADVSTPETQAFLSVSGLWVTTQESPSFCAPEMSPLISA